MATADVDRSVERLNDRVCALCSVKTVGVLRITVFLVARERLDGCRRPSSGVVFAVPHVLEAVETEDEVAVMLPIHQAGAKGEEESAWRHWVCFKLTACSIR
jgi:hypothetical protein